jgi:hypothetical protein
MNAHQPIKMASWTAGNTDAFTAEQLRPYGVLLVTITGTSFGPVPCQGSTKTENKHKLYCKGLPEDHSTLVVGAVCNRRFLARVLGGTSTKDWPGKQIWIYHDPTAEYGGETVGGIRFAWGDEYSGQLEKRRKNQPRPPRPPKPTPIPSRTSQPRQAPPAPPPPDDPPPEAYDPETGEVPGESREPGQEG